MPPQMKKGQFNMPFDESGCEMQVMKPGLYEYEQLLVFAFEQEGRPRSNSDDSFETYWNAWKTSELCPRVLVGRSGIVAVKFADKERWRVLQQQWSYQGMGLEDQKYLCVWLAANPCYPEETGPFPLHRLVGMCHPNYTEDAIYEDENGLLRLKRGAQVDHADTNKANNSAHNLFWVSSTTNQKMMGWDVEYKKQQLRKVTIDASLINQ